MVRPNESKEARLSPIGIVRLAALLAALVLAVPPAAWADPNPPTSSYEFTGNMEPLGYARHSPHASGQFNSDLAFWGATAYQGTYMGFQNVDISNPEDPKTILDYDDCRGNQGDVIIWEDILIRSWNSPSQPGGVPPALPTCDGQTVPEGFEGLHIFDVGNPADPQLIGSMDLECGSHTATGVPDLANNRLLVYNSASSTACPGIDIVEVPLGNPGAPTLLGRAQAGRSCHDTGVILGDAMLAACAGGNGFTMFSLGGARGGSLVDPLFLYSRPVEGVSVGHSASFSWDGELLIFGHEPGGGFMPECEANDEAVKKTMFFFSSADGAPVGRWVLPRPQTVQENCTIHNFNVVPSGVTNIVVQGNYQAGISVVDFTTPQQPVEIAYADPAPLSPVELEGGGDWSSYWYDGEIYESDMTRGLITWRLNDPAVETARTLGHLNPQTQEFTIPFTGKPERCKGKDVTLFGTNQKNVLKGTSKADVILAGDGDDTVRARKGNDIVCAGPGNDVLKGGAGNDVLLGGSGDDTARGGAGKDTFKGGAGRDRGSGIEKGR
jgi:hypothetical protein